MKLLVVDDCTEIVEILCSTIELSGHEAHEAYNGIEAIERLRDSSYDVVITDAEMPGMGGIEVCKFVKSQFPGVYIIAISGSFDSLRKLKNAGADICLPKPFSISEIEEAIENRFSSSLRGREAAASYGSNDLL